MAKEALTAPRVRNFTCPSDKTQAFLWDINTKGLGVRATPNGKPAYIFQAPFQGKDIRVTIGSPETWGLGQAKEKARELQRQIDEGKDPRRLKLDALETEAKFAAQRKLRTLTVGEVWARYVAARRPVWRELHYRDHIDKAKPGGMPSNARGRKLAKTKPGPLASLMPLKLKDLDQETIEKWAAKEGAARPASARLSWRLLTVFMNWCSEQSDLKELVPAKNPAKTTRAREALGKAETRSEVLQKGQLSAWFDAIQRIKNPVVAAYLQVTLLTGARSNEALSIQWSDVNFQWGQLTIGDKINRKRVIPLTPYVRMLLLQLPRRNHWAFSSATSKDGRISKPNTPLSRACQSAGLKNLTIQGLRRSFSSLTEWLDVPVGIVAQIQGHRPSAIAEKHYKRRSIELLALHHTRIEAWILEQAGIHFEPKEATGNLQLIAGGA